VRAAALSSAVSENATVVLVEDDPSIADLVILYLGDAGFRVHLATDGERAIEAIRSRQPALVLLDLGLPGDIDGIEVCREIRQTSTVPVIMVTARDDETDRIAGLELGADDYVTKPFSPGELVARVKAVLRRGSHGAPTAATGGAEPATLRAGDVVIDRARREVTVSGRPVPTTQRDFDLLEHLALHAGQVLSRIQIIEAVWGHDWPGDERTIDVHVRQLRRKLGDGLPLATVWGVGYRLD
jgi:DNA-binding response OmpR family regulator